MTNQEFQIYEYHLNLKKSTKTGVLSTQENEKSTLKVVPDNADYLIGGRFNPIITK